MGFWTFLAIHKVCIQHVKTPGLQGLVPQWARKPPVEMSFCGLQWASQLLPEIFAEFHHVPSRFILAP